MNAISGTGFRDLLKDLNEPIKLNFFNVLISKDLQITWFSPMIDFLALLSTENRFGDTLL